MRSLTRLAFAAPTLKDSGVGGRRRLSDRAEYEKTGAVPDDFPDHWTNPDVRGLLHATQGLVCAYCGRLYDALHVEHFRPKASVQGDKDHDGYWWLAYEFSNYLLGCSSCNQKRKGTGFPLLSGAVRSTYKTLSALAGERRILLDPCEDPLDDWLTIDREDLTGRLIPNPELDQPLQERIKQALHRMGTNLDSVARPERAESYRTAAKAASEGRWDDLRRHAMRHKAHSLAARIILRRESQPPAAPEVEAIDLLDSLFHALAALIDEVQDARARNFRVAPVDERQLKALGWALLILSAHPPAGDPLTYEERLAQALEKQTSRVREEFLTLFRSITRGASLQ